MGTNLRGPSGHDLQLTSIELTDGAGRTLTNYWVGSRIGRLDPSHTLDNRPPAKRWLVAGVTVNLAVLAYFKYAGFFLANVNAILGHLWARLDCGTRRPCFSHT